jgi:predicted glycoside hydrolase/deacetylase ChbG (UPF0249 family)
MARQHHRHAVVLRQADERVGGLDTLRMVLNEVPEGITELICHPGYARDLDEAYNAPREDELRCLTDSGIRQLIEDQRIELVTFAALNGG